MSAKVESQPSDSGGTKDTSEGPGVDLASVKVEPADEDVLRAIERVKEIPDEELQGFLDDKDFMESLDVVDAWEGDDAASIPGDNPQQTKPSTHREKHRREPKDSHSRNKSKDKKREESRRDPSKSNKDIERDKIRTKKDNETKLLAEKEKAIKNLLDSGNIVPPGTEVEAIQSFTEKQNIERSQVRVRRSKERRRSVDRHKTSPAHRRSSERRVSPIRRRSPLLLDPERRRSPLWHNSDRRSPLVLSPERRRSPFGRNRDRRSSQERKWSPDRHRRHVDSHERNRRSRSFDRQRSRSLERLRRRSRSPLDRRYSPRRRSRSRSRSPDRRRKRSPFINELARQLRNEAMTPAVSTSSNYVQPTSMMNSMMNMYQAPTDPRQPPLPPPAQPLPPLPLPYMHQSAPQPPPPPPGGMPVGPMPPYMNFDGSPQLMNFEPTPVMQLPQPDYSAGPVIYSQPNSAPLQPVHRPSLLSVSIPSPQPVPAPAPVQHAPLAYTSPHNLLPIQRSPMKSPHETSSKSTSVTTAPSSAPQTFKEVRNIDPSTIDFRTIPKPNLLRPEEIDFRAPPKSDPRSIDPRIESRSQGDPRIKSRSIDPRSSARSISPYNGYKRTHDERLKTPEPPVISTPKPFEKTSLSSLLEASVSAKDSSNLPVLYPGFKPEILRHCEHALRELPMEDPRLKMKGRFFFDPYKDDTQNELEEYSSNSILLQKGKNKISWTEEEEQHASSAKAFVQTHQKICQTDEIETENKFIQATVIMVNAEVQVNLIDIKPVIKEEKKPIMDRLDWNMRETFDYTPKYREVDDLRWSLSSSQKSSRWNRTSPPRRSEDRERDRHVELSLSPERGPRTVDLEPPQRSRDSYSSHRGPSAHDHYARENWSPTYDPRHNEHDRRHEEFHETRSNHSLGESPMVLDDSEEDMDTEMYQRSGPTSDWHSRTKSAKGRSSPSGKMHVLKGKQLSGRSFRGRGGFRPNY